MDVSTPKHAARVLGLDEETTLSEVRRVRRKMAMKYHPDQSDDQERATRHMARINAAADALIAHLQKPSPKRSTQAAKPTGARPTARNAARPTRHTDMQAHVMEAAKHTRTAPLSEEECALSRMAAASYKSVLDKVSRPQATPAVDATAMPYPGASSNAHPA